MSTSYQVPKSGGGGEAVRGYQGFEAPDLDANARDIDSPWSSSKGGGGGMAAMSDVTTKQYVMSDAESKETISRLQAELDSLKKDRAVRDAQSSFRSAAKRSTVGAPAEAGGMAKAAATVRSGAHQEAAKVPFSEENKNVREAMRVVLAAADQAEMDKNYAIITGMAPYPDEVRQQVANARTPQGRGREMPHAGRYDRSEDMRRALDIVQSLPASVDREMSKSRMSVADWVPENNRAAKAGLTDAAIRAMYQSPPLERQATIPSDPRLKELDRQLGSGSQMPASERESGNPALDREAAVAAALNAEDEYTRRALDETLRGGIQTQGSEGGMDERTRLQYAMGAQNDAPWRYRPDAQQAMGLDNKTHFGVSDAERLARSGPVGQSVTEQGPDGLWRIDGAQMASTNAAMLAEHEKELQRLKDALMRREQPPEYDTPERRMALENMTYGR